MRQIAYVGEDGEIFVYDLDLDEDTPVSRVAEGITGSDGARLTNWPTWSPDGQQLAYFRYEVVGTEVAASGVYVVGPDGASGRVVYHAPNEAPIYMCWSPDSQRIAVLVQAQDQLYLRVVDAREQRSPQTVAQGAPLYFTWQPDSRGLVIHVGLGRRSMPQTRISWLRLEGGQVSQAPLARSPAQAFRAPCWSTQREAATLAVEGGIGSEIVVQRSPEADPEPLFSTGLSPAYAWNARGDLLACAARQPDEGTLYSGISLYSVADGQVRELVETPVLAYFWSPAGDRLVYATGDVGDRVIAVRSVDAATGDEADIGWVRPSRDLFMLFSHFDQYCQSASLISPEGDALVLAASRAKERENGSVPTVRQILVRSLAQGGDERVIARGRLAVWRPR